MGLPPQLQEDFIAEFKREPNIVARAVCDITGEEGLTWLACDGTMLVCYSRPAGGEFSRLDYHLAEATGLEVREDGSHAFLKARLPEAEFELKFPPGEMASLAKLATLQPPSDSVDVVKAPAMLTPNLICGAAVYAMAQADGEHAKEELDWVVARFGNLNSFRRGGAWVAKHGFAKLLTEAGQRLTAVQMESVLMNLIDMGFADNRLSREEITMLDEWRQAAGQSEEQYQRGYEAMLAAASLGALVNSTASGPDWTPVNLLCAAVLGVIQHRPETSERRIKALERRIQSTDAINAGQTYLDQLGPDGLATVLGEMLLPAQRRCVLANVLREAFKDGEPSPEVVDYLRLVQEGMGLSPADFAAEVRVFRSLGNPGLFHEAGPPP